MIRPQPCRFIPGIAAFMPWNTADRLIAMIASQRSSGNPRSLAMNWMPALFTRMSSEPSFACGLRHHRGDLLRLATCRRR